MESVMIIFERDKPRNMIIWTIIFLFTSLVGYLIYMIFKIVNYKNKISLKLKQNEDAIYKKLIENKLSTYEYREYNELFHFNKIGFSARLTNNNQVKTYNNFKTFLDKLIGEINSAKNYILIEITSINFKEYNDLKSALINRAKAGVLIKLVYEKNLGSKVIKELKAEGIKLYKFSKYPRVSNYYRNLRNIISIDGNTCFSCDLNIKKKQLRDNVETLNLFLELKGNVVQDIDVAVRQDIVFASGKYIEYEERLMQITKTETKIQYVINEFSRDLELSIIKAISLSKSSIQLQLDEYIPSECIMSLLKFAIHSNIEVKLMVPLKTYKHSKYFASRAYAKELALTGAKVYLFDGYIRYNSIVIDDKYAIVGSYTINRDQINNCMQNIIIVEDDKVVNYLNNMFNNAVENSYKISNAKYMLLREKFFKNFI